MHNVRKKHSIKLNDKLLRLPEEQERPLFDVNNTVICVHLDRNPPKYAMDILSLGPKNSALGKFDDNFSRIRQSIELL